MNWLRRLFGRGESPPPAPPARDEPAGVNPYPAETAVHWSAEDQEGSAVEDRGEWMEKGEPDPRRQDNPST